MSSALRTLLARSQQPIRNMGIQRCLVTSSSGKQKPLLSTEAAKEIETDTYSILRDGTNHKVDNWEKRFLVWTGKYKTVHDVPPTVPQGMMEKTRNKMRIKICNYMMLATALASLVVIYSGKQAAKRGESLQKMNLEWHRQLKDEVAPSQ